MLHAEQKGLINLEDAQRLVDLLANGMQDQADDFFRELIAPLQNDLFDEVGKLTRQLHNQLSGFSLDNRLQEMTESGLPDASERLNYVISMTENAANRTMDAVDVCLPLTGTILRNIQDLQPSWEKFKAMDADAVSAEELNGFRQEVESFVSFTETDALKLQEMLSEILIAQDYQDLTSQVLRHVINLVTELQTSLVSLLKAFGDSVLQSKGSAGKRIETSSLVEAEGPIINQELRLKQDVVDSQDDVDDLLSSLGF